MTAWMLSLLLASLARADPAEIRVCPRCEARSVSEAVGRAAPGARVIVGRGLYREHGIQVTKPIEIAGEPGAVIDGEDQGDILVLASSGIRVSGLELRRSGFSFINDRAAIKVLETTGVVVERNALVDNAYGVYLAKASDAVVADNEIRGPRRSESEGGNGVHAWQSRNLRIDGNRVSGHRDGIYFEFVNDSVITRNRVEGNSRYGLHFMFSNRDEYAGNVFLRNDSGVAVMYSKKIRMIGNRFEESRGGASYGILLKDIAESDIRGNRFASNTVGAFVEGTTRSVFEGNDFVANGWAIRILGNSDGNLIQGNNFVANTFDVSTNTFGSFNRFTKNYWSGYRGLDADQDGFGDTPYRPIRLSSVLVEDMGASILLLKSLFFVLTDQAEAVFPTLTAESLVDEQPRMERA